VGASAAADASRAMVETAALPFRSLGVASAFETVERKSPRRKSRLWVVAAGVGTVIAIGGPWTQHRTRRAVEANAIGAFVKPTERAPNDGVVTRSDGPPLGSAIRPPEPITIATPVQHAGDEVPAAGRRPEMRIAPRPLDHTPEPAAPAPSPLSARTSGGAPSVPATPSAPFITAAPPAATSTLPTAGSPTSLAATPAPIPTVQPSYGPGPSGPDRTVVQTKVPPDDQLLVNQTLQRYRLAYDELDARSAQAVWPSVNHVALARAFEALESQTLSFETCDIQLQTRGTATATCRGFTQYVPKIGNRDPHTESRVWSFNLRKEGNDWTIERALVAR
jgi:hypothetical protein